MSESAAVTKQKSKIYSISMCAVAAAAICVLAPLSIPIGPVPITLATLVIYVMLYLLGWKLSVVSCAVYLLLGVCGLPVFSGFSGGAGKLLGPTGGYLIGYLLIAAIGGAAVERFQSRMPQFLGMALGTAACYLLGTAWFCFVSQMEVVPALSLAVFPFIPFDIAKMAAAMLIGPVIRERLIRAGLIRGASD